MKPVRAVVFSGDHSVLPPTAKSNCCALAKLEPKISPHASVKKKNFLNPPPCELLVLGTTLQPKPELTPVVRCVKMTDSRQGATPADRPPFVAFRRSLVGTADSVSDRAADADYVVRTEEIAVVENVVKARLGTNEEIPPDVIA